MTRHGEVLTTLSAAYARLVTVRLRRALTGVALLIAAVGATALTSGTGSAQERHPARAVAGSVTSTSRTSGPGAAPAHPPGELPQVLVPRAAIRSPAPQLSSAAGVSSAPPGIVSPARPRTVPVVILAHRGGQEHAPENSMAAFDDAVLAGADYIETDVRHSLDGVAFLMHDPTLRARCAPYTGQPVMALTAAQLAQVRCAGQPVPRLSDLVQRLSRPDAARIRVMAEVKDVDPLGVRDELATLGTRRVLIQSYNLDALRLIERMSPQVRTCPLIWTADQLPEALKVTHDCVGIDWHAVDAGFVARAHGAGVVVYAYTVDDRAEMRTLADVGVDGLITDRPRVARAAVALP